MSKLKLLKAIELEKLLFTLGFNAIRKNGSHVFYKHPDGRSTVIPFHSGKDLSRPLIRTIIQEINISIDQYNELVK